MASGATTAQVLQALTALYSGTNSATTEQANRWLNEFQSTEEAWKTADLLLNDNSTTLEARLFAAQTFRKKVTYDLHQLDTTARQSLRDSLINQLIHLKSGPSVLITQICLTLNALAMQLPSWVDVVPQMIKLLGTDAEAAPCLLEFLTVLPEEVNGNYRIPITDVEFAERSKVLLTDNAAEVFRLMLWFMQNSGNNTGMQERAFRCLLSWIRSGDIPVMEMANSPLLGMAFEAMRSDELFDVAVDVICEVIHETSEIEDCMSLVEQIYTQLQSLRAMIPAAAEDSDQLRGICRVFTEAGETYVPLASIQADAYHGILDGVLDCISVHDLDIVKMTFNLWYSLKQYLSIERHESAKPRFVDVFRRLVEIIIGHLHYPADLATWTAEERDDFRDFRHEMGDVLKDSCAILGVKEALAIPCHRMETLLANAATPWQEIEAPLFSLRSMGSEVPMDEEELMPRIMAMLLRLPEHPKFIEFQMNLISSGFENAEVAAASALALKFLCKDASESLISYLGMLLPFYTSVGKTLGRDDLLEVTEALAHVIAAVPVNQVLKTLQTFCLPVCQELHTIASKGAQASQAELQKASVLLDQLSLFIGNVAPNVQPDQEHPCLQLVTDLMPVFTLLQTHHASHAAVSESLCKCYSACAESYGVHFRPLLPQLMERLGNAFAATDLSCYLWVARKCIRSMNGSIDGAPIALNFVEALSTVMFSLVQKVAQVSEIPDVVEEYFRLLLAMQQDYSVPLLRSHMISSMLQCAMACLSVGQAYPLMAALDFIRDLLVCGLQLQGSSDYELTDRAMVVQLAVANGKTLVGLLIDGALHGFQRDMAQDVAVIVEILAQLAPTECAAWLAEEISKIPETRLARVKRDRFIECCSVAIREKDWRRIRRQLNDIIAYYWRQNSDSESRRI